jgi:hypothetical protein
MNCHDCKTELTDQNTAQWAGIVDDVEDRLVYKLCHDCADKRLLEIRGEPETVLGNLREIRSCLSGLEKTLYKPGEFVCEEMASLERDIKTDLRDILELLNQTIGLIVHEETIREKGAQ